MATGRDRARGRGATGATGTGGLRLSETCTWCGAEVEKGDGFRAYEPAGERRAVFCRLEHLVPWALQDAHWDSADVVGERLRHQTGCSSSTSRVALSRALALPEHPRIERCSQCGAELSDVHVLLVRHRGEHRVADGFCSVDHMEQWAKAGGRWQ